MGETATQQISDDWGVIIQKMGGNGRWYNWKRVTKDGYSFLLMNPKTVDYMTALEAAHVHFALNLMSDDILVNGELLSDNLEGRIFNNLFDFGLNSRQRVREAWQEAAFRNAYHPIKDYLNGLEWDGVDRAYQLLEHFDFNGDQEWASAVMLKWMVGAVAKIYEQAQLFMLVLDGSQGCGKSYFVRWLCPLSGYFVEGPINPGMKDTDIESINKWIWEVSELQATTRRADRESLKAHITKQTVSVRKPYGRNSITKPVTAAYLGTINQDAGFLEDDSGNRRFVIVSVANIDWAYESINVDQLWAQIVTLYKSGHDWELTVEEARQRDEVNKEYDAPHPVIELFLEYYTHEPGLYGDDFMPTIDVIMTLEDAGLKGNQRANMMKLTAWLKAQGCNYTRTAEGGEQRRGFYGIKQVKSVPVDSNGGSRW
jgi:hypothetical protein